MFPSSVQTDVLFLASYSAVFILVCYLLRNKKVHGRSLKEYIWPVRAYIPMAMVAVAWQYVGLFERADAVGQAIWASAVALSVATLVYKHGFGLGNTVFFGVWYSLLIHGSKCSLRYFIYGVFDPRYRTVEYIGSRFIYGSMLAVNVSMLVALALYLETECLEKQKNMRRISLLILGVILTVATTLVMSKVYEIYLSRSL